jgi:glycosyltransferase involved in cell wall biosynthesis
VKILFVVPYYAPAFSYGGVVSATTTQAEELVKLGYSVTVITTDVFDNKNRNSLKIEIINGVEIIRFRNISNFAAKHLNFYTGHGMSKWIKTEIKKFNLIHIADIFSFLIIKPVVREAIKNNIPYLIQPHGLLIKDYIEYNGILSVIKNYILKTYDEIFDKSSAILSVSDFETKHLNSVFPKDKIYKVPNGIEIMDSNNDISELKTKYFPNENRKILISLGRLSFVKGFERSIKAVSELYKINQDFLYLIYGPSEKNTKANLEKLINDLNAKDYIKLMGPVYDEQKFAVLSCADLFLMSSLSEAQGIVVIEALNSGLPAIISNESYLSEYTGFECCTKSDFNNPVNLAKHINNIIRNEEILTKMRSDTKQLLAQHFGLKSTIKNLADVYAKILNERNIAC